MGFVTKLLKRFAPSAAKAHPIDDFESDIPRYPPFARGLPVASADKIMETQSALIADIRKGLALGDEFDTLVLPVISRFAEYVHLLPASENHHHRGAGGLFRHSLEVGFYAARASEAVVFTRQSYPSATKALEPRWRMASFLGGLFHDAGKPISDVTVVTPDGKHEWNTFTDPTIYEWATRLGIERYHLRWTANRHGRHERHTPHALYQLMTVDMKGYMQEAGKEVPEALMDALTGLSVTTPLSKLIIQADSNSVEKDLREQHIGHVDQHAVGVAAERYIISAMRSLVADGEWKANTAGAVLWIGEDGVYINWRPAVKQITQRLAKDKIPGIPQSPESLAEILLERELAEGQRVVSDNDSVDLLPYWHVKIDGINIGNGIGKIDFLALKVPVDLLYSSVAPPPSWDGIEIVHPDDENADQDEGRQACEGETDTAESDDHAESAATEDAQAPDEETNGHTEAHRPADSEQDATDTEVEQSGEPDAQEPETGSETPATTASTDETESESVDKHDASARDSESREDADSATASPLGAGRQQLLKRPLGKPLDDTPNRRKRQTKAAKKAGAAKHRDGNAENTPAVTSDSPTQSDAGDTTPTTPQADTATPTAATSPSDEPESTAVELPEVESDAPDSIELDMEDDADVDEYAALVEEDEEAPPAPATESTPALGGLMANLSRATSPSHDNDETSEPFDEPADPAASETTRASQQADTPSPSTKHSHESTGKDRDQDKATSKSTRQADNDQASATTAKRAEGDESNHKTPRTAAAKPDNKPAKSRKQANVPNRRSSSLATRLGKQDSAERAAGVGSSPLTQSRDLHSSDATEAAKTETSLPRRDALMPTRASKAKKPHAQQTPKKRSLNSPKKKTKPRLPQHPELIEAMLDGLDNQKRSLGERVDVTTDDAVCVNVPNVARALGLSHDNAVLALQKTDFLSSEPTTSDWLTLDGKPVRRLIKTLRKTAAYQATQSKSSHHQAPVKTASKAASKPSSAPKGAKTPPASHEATAGEDSQASWWRDEAVTQTPGKADTAKPAQQTETVTDEQDDDLPTSSIQTTEDAVKELANQMRRGRGRWLTATLHHEGDMRRISDVVLGNIREENPALTPAAIKREMRRSGQANGIERRNRQIFVKPIDESSDEKAGDQ
ncbi:MobH family relaxase [Vreelandella massiliensis]|uniref:MobH family relaxase n=1 Tax=Vreelandella massiliensis TaxID=1816686 RepID=UPI00096A5920|nr:MobH family relaxase [Halomonas massiliensis]